MERRVVGLISLIGVTGVTATLVACSGGSAPSDETSAFDSGEPVGTIDSGTGALGDDDATAPTIKVTGGGGGTNGDAGSVLDCDATPLACVKQVCGDGTIEPGETCDDGNVTSGDGCSSSCQLEGDYYACAAGQPCVDTRNCEELVEAGALTAGSDSGCSAPPKAAVCGDGFLDPGEACDTGSDVGTATSGCAKDCSSTFDGYVCPTAGTDCTNTWICGDGKVEGGEQCDEGTANQTKGCVACAITSGWACTIAGTSCVAAKCGDGLVAGNEQCDTGSTTQNGCVACRLASTSVPVAATATAAPSTVITNYACGYATAGDAYQTCAATVCGNGIREGSEQCDNDAHVPAHGYDGCSSQCQIEPSCPSGACVATCGDGIVFDFDGNGDGKPDELCDDGNTAAGDGCSTTCQPEAGYSCTISVPTAPAYVDVPVVFRDMLYAGTTATVKAPGDTTAHSYAHPDFQFYSGSKSTPDLNKTALVNSVPVFEWDGYHDPVTGLPTAIDPVTGVANPNTSNQQQLTVFTATGKLPDYSKAVDYGDWFADVLDPRGAGLESTRGMRVDNQSIRMTLQGNGSYVFDSNCDLPYGAGYTGTTCNTVSQQVYSSTDKKVEAQTQYGGLGGFYPLDGKGWNTVLATPQTDVDQWTKWSGTGTTNVAAHAAHNFSFTTQFRYYFTFDAAAAASATPPTLAFSGDDDVWVFLDNQRVLDLGGLHSRLPGSFVLNTALAKQLGLQDQHVYEVDLFNAERHTTASNFALTLDGFVKKTSVCTAVCGDGTRTPNEQCDNGTPPTLDPTGTNTGDGSYDSCTTSCTLGPYCGDKKVTAPQESCDDGVNQTSYVTSAAAAATSCAPGCVKPAYCGDGALQQTRGEVCDNGAKNADNAYGGCTTKCALGPRCGDKVVESSDGEVCDNGYNATSYLPTLTSDSCAPGCKLPAYCGNGTVDVPYEICDDGANNSNGGAYGSCTTSCKLGPHCGDGVVQSPQESCDDGNQRSGDGCSAGCQTENGGIR